MEKFRKLHISDHHIVLIAAAMLAASLFFSGWHLGNRRAESIYQADIATLEAENIALSDEVNTLMAKVEVAESVSAKTALKILHAEHPKDSKLVTIEYPFSDCDRFSYFQMIDEWRIPFTEKAFTIKWNGVITAGIDMADVTITTSKNGSKLIVTIPTPKILTYTIDDESFELLDEQNNIFNPITLEDLPVLDDEIEAKMKAIESEYK